MPMAKMIPPNATLEFEIEMIEWTAATREDNIAQTIAEAQESKQQGTVMYKQGQFALALEKYQAAHDSIAYLYPAPEGEDLTTIAKLRLHCWLNIAACRLKLKQYPEAASAATDALKLDTGNTKALFRRGQAYIGLHQWDKANSDLVSAAKAEPSNKEIRDELEALKKARIREKEVYQRVMTSGKLYEDVKPAADALPSGRAQSSSWIVKVGVAVAVTVAAVAAWALW
eukprot:TRINITY_DN7185_c0_g1_i2.p1 TRINITY_DN7185_c0_g1~~TRINITY_DN7185_c0_g1_i2.p1  ORF type:complete len:228 (-),score=59.55 TRINITY_DN7185_c0_g1_i2:43-726(-)